MEPGSIGYYLGVFCLLIGVGLGYYGYGLGVLFFGLALIIGGIIAQPYVDRKEKKNKAKSLGLDIPKMKTRAITTMLIVAILAGGFGTALPSIFAATHPANEFYINTTSSASYLFYPSNGHMAAFIEIESHVSGALSGVTVSQATMDSMSATGLSVTSNNGTAMEVLLGVQTEQTPPSVQVEITLSNGESLSGTLQL